MPLKLAVITPTGNRVEYLKQCVQSVAASVLAPIDVQVEHVIMCSGDDGQTSAWLSGPDAPKNLVYLESEKNLSPGQARNNAIRASQSDWIALLDDDDVMLQRTLHNFAQAIQQHPGTQWFVSDFLRVDEELRYTPGDDYYGWQFGRTDEMLQAIFRSEHFIQGNVCFNRQLFDLAGGYDTERRTAEDLELYCRFLLQDALPKALPMTSHLHRMHTRNTSRDIDANHHFNDLRQIYAKLEKQLESRNVTLELPNG